VLHHQLSPIDAHPLGGGSQWLVPAIAGGGGASAAALAWIAGFPLVALALLAGGAAVAAILFARRPAAAVADLAQAVAGPDFSVVAAALALGMAIDANVLINERVREELRSGASPQAAINIGYERAWATILDSNVTTLIAGLALLAFGSGPVRGFAIVHSLGIITSMFSAVMFSRGLVNLWYGRQKRLKSVSIGQVWKPGTT